MASQKLRLTGKMWPLHMASCHRLFNSSELKKKLKLIQGRVQAALSDNRASTLLSCGFTTPYPIKDPELPLTPQARSIPEKEVKPPGEGQPASSLKPLGPADHAQSSLKSFDQAHGSAQDQLTEELSQMAAQLKKNAHHFNKLLAEDQLILQANQAKLDINSGLMSQQGGRLSEVSLKSRGTTWFTILALVAVVVAWVIMFIIIRLS